MSSVNDAAERVMRLLKEQPSPREAAAVLAVVRANLWVHGGADTKAKARTMMEEDDAVVMEIWETITEQHRAH